MTTTRLAALAVGATALLAAAGCGAGASASTASGDIPVACVEALDRADEAMQIASDAFGHIGEAMEAVITRHPRMADAVDELGSDIDAAKTAVPRYRKAAAECRAAG